MFESISLSFASGIPLFIFTQIVDPHKDMERYFHRYKKENYYLLQLAMTTLFLAFAFNMKYIAMQIFSHLKK